MKKMILKTIILTLIILFSYSNKIYARGDFSFGEYYYAIQGNAYENIEGMENIEDMIKIPNIIVDLYDEQNRRVATTLTDKNGQYTFADLPAGNYTVRFRWGEVSEKYINNTTYTDTERIKIIQNALKYNAQDYGSEYKEYAGSLASSEIQLSIIIDRSGSMIGERIERAKQLATDIVSKLLEEQVLGSQSNVEISLVSYNDKATLDSELTNDAESLIQQIENIEAMGENNEMDAFTQAYNVKNFDGQNRFIFLLSDGVGADMDEVQKLIGEIMDDGVQIYTLFIGDEMAHQIAYDYYYMTEFVEVNSNTFEDDTELEGILNGFIGYLQNSIGYEEVEEDAVLRDFCDKNFKELKYDNTVIFEAIDMKVDSTNIEKFKKYAKMLSKLARMEGYSSKICTITSPRI